MLFFNDKAYPLLYSVRMIVVRSHIFYGVDTLGRELIVYKICNKPYACYTYERVYYSRADVRARRKHPVDHVKVEDTDNQLRAPTVTKISAIIVIISFSFFI